MYYCHCKFEKLKYVTYLKAKITADYLLPVWSIKHSMGIVPLLEQQPLSTVDERISKSKVSILSKESKSRSK